MELSKERKERKERRKEMAEKLTGVLEKKERMRSAKGTEYFMITVAGAKMSAFREKMSEVEGAKEGDTVEVEWEPDKTGRFKNLVSLAVQTSVPSTVSDQVEHSGREIGIARLAIGHDVMKIISGTVTDFPWLEENKDRVTHLYGAMVDALLTAHLASVYGPEE